MATPEIGDPAPEFTLDGTHGPFVLADHLGRRVVLLFYPRDGTPVCTRQFRSYRDRAGDMAALDAVVVGISSGDEASKEAFARRHRLRIPLLADPSGDVAGAYGVRRLGTTRRAVVVVDELGRIAHRHRRLPGLGYDGVDDIRALLERLPAPA